jgi:hypothetical protein
MSVSEPSRQAEAIDCIKHKFVVIFRYVHFGVSGNTLTSIREYYIPLQHLDRLSLNK